MAQYNLAICYLNGIGVSLDSSKAIQYYHSAADKGYVMAQYNLAICYEIGKGVHLLVI